MQVGYCPNCGGADDGRIALIPKAWMHINCMLSLGGDPWEVAESLSCCQAMTSLASLGGGLHIRDERIPQNQIWIPNRKRLTRFEIHDSGALGILQNLERETLYDPDAEGYESAVNGLEPVHNEGETDAC